MIDENRKCKEYLNNPEMLVKYVAEKLSIPFDSRRIWSGMTYYAQFISDSENLFNAVFKKGSLVDALTNAFIYAPFSKKFTINYSNYTYDVSRTHICDNDTVKEVIDKITESIKEYQQHMKQRRIDAIITAAASFEA